MRHPVMSRFGPEVKGAGGTCTRSGSRHQVEGQGGAASFVERVNVGAGTGMAVAGARLSTSISGRSSVFENPQGDELTLG